LTRWLRERGAEISGSDYVAVLAGLQAAARAAVAASEPYDAVLVPTLAAPPLPVGALRDDGDPAADFAAQERFNPFSAAYNLTGQPAVTLPLYWTGAGLPIGVQLVGRPAGEAVLLALATQLEEARPWAERRPLLWSARPGD
jgi:amidase